MQFVPTTIIFATNTAQNEFRVFRVFYFGVNAGPNKVWKKQPGGPPALPSSTRSEVREGLSGISTTDFESQVRSMLATINTGGVCDSDDGGCGGPPFSFPVETVCQVGEESDEPASEISYSC